MYIKPTASFRLSKQDKRFLATIIDPHKRGEIKRGMIQAQLASEQQPPKREKSNDRRQGGSGQNHGGAYVAPEA